MKPTKKESPWANNGGARLGSGRKPLPNARVRLCLTVPPDVKRFLETVNASQCVTDSVVASAQFAEWKKTANIG